MVVQSHNATEPQFSLGFGIAFRLRHLLPLEECRQLREVGTAHASAALRKRGVTSRLAQTMQAGLRIPVGIQVYIGLKG